MTNLKLSYSGNDLLGYTGETSGIHINESNTIELPSKYGSGLIKNLWFEEGFAIHYINFSVKDDLEFEWFSQPDNGQVVYKLIYILETPGKNTLGFKNKMSFASNQNNTILYLPDSVKKVLIEKDTRIHRVALLFTGSWLERNYSEALDKINSLMKDLKVKNKPTVISELIDNKSFILANEMANEMNNT